MILVMARLILVMARLILVMARLILVMAHLILVMARHRAGHRPERKERLFIAYRLMACSGQAITNGVAGHHEWGGRP